MSEPAVIRDLVVLLPGILGSTLAKDDELVWAPSAGAALKAIWTFGRSIRDLKLPEGINDEHPGDGVEPIDLMPDIHVLPGIWSANIGYEALLDWLRSRFHLVEAPADDPDRIANLLPVPYDWRLSNRYNGRRLEGIVRPALEKWQSQGGPFAGAKVIFICHSMGGLVARWYIEKEGGAEITGKLITLGTPFRGSLNAFDQLVNGVKKGIWPFNLDITEFARSLPSTYQLLPEYACIESPEGLRKITETPVPELATEMVTDGMTFHVDLDEAASSHPLDTYSLHPTAGRRQRTGTTARIVGSNIEVINTIEGVDEGGDATVPLLSAVPKELDTDSNIIRRPADKHGSLQSNIAVLDELDGVLSANPIRHRGSHGIEVGVELADIILAGEVLEIRAVPQEPIKLHATVEDESGQIVAHTYLNRSEVGHRGAIADLPPGAFQVVVGGADEVAPLVAEVTSPLLVWHYEGP